MNRDALSEAKVLLAGLDLVPLTGAVVDVAGDVDEPLLLAPGAGELPTDD